MSRGRQRFTKAEMRRAADVARATGSIPEFDFIHGRVTFRPVDAARSEDDAQALEDKFGAMTHG